MTGFAAIGEVAIGEESVDSVPPGFKVIVTLSPASITIIDPSSKVLDSIGILVSMGEMTVFHSQPPKNKPSAAAMIGHG